MLRLSMECARIAVRGDDYAQTLATGVESIMRADAGASVIAWHMDGSTDQDDRSVRIVVAGIPEVDDEYIAGAVEVAARHPSFNYRNWFDTPTSRVSDLITPSRFWDTDVWVRMHGHVDARYPAAVNMGSHGGVAVFLGVQRTRVDFSDADMAVLDRIRGPLTAALAFRNAWDTAARRLQATVPDGLPPLTRREAQVLALVARGWTNGRIGHALTISERTVRKHLENANQKLGTADRASAVDRWRSLQSTVELGTRPPPPSKGSC